MPASGEAHRSRTDARPAVVLVNMPFAGFRQPSLALGLLKASLAALPVEARIIDATLDFAGLISPQTYDAIATWRAEDLLADWVFAAALRGAAADPGRGDDPADQTAMRSPQRVRPRERGRTWEQYVDEVLAGGLPDHQVPYFGKPPLTASLKTQILHARAAVDGFLQTCCDEIAASRPLLVGFTTMVGQQTAALALARLVKKTLPAAYVVFGGAACREPMGSELLRSFPFVDAVATGDGESVLPALVERLLGDHRILAAGIPGLAVRHPGTGADWRAEEASARPESLAAAPDTPGVSRDCVPIDLDSLPTPDFNEYFVRLERSAVRDAVRPRIPFETSRGCWWGERQRCVFCGQASEHLTYRVKSPDRVLQELADLSRRHPGMPFVFTDEIVPGSFADELAPLLPERLPDLRVLYYETRPDLTKDQLAGLARAGVRRLEVGIESLSTPVLRLMRKGTTALQGLQFLKWARELGVTVVWNLIWGMPGETDAHDAAMADLARLVTHLQPPHTVGAVRLDRFSPLHEDPEAWGITGVRPYPAYEHVYDLPPEALGRLAYFLRFDHANASAAGDRAVAGLAERIDEWKRAFPAALLWYTDDGRRLVLSDSRPGFDAGELTVLDGDHRLLYLACDSMRSAASLAAIAEGTPTIDCVHRTLMPLVEQGLMVREGERYLSLALALPRPQNDAAAAAASRVLGD